MKTAALLAAAALLSSCMVYERWDAASQANEASRVLLVKCHDGDSAACAYVQGQGLTITRR